MNDFWYINNFNIFLGGGTLGKMNKSKMAKWQNAVVFQNIFLQILQDAMTRYKIVEKGKDTLPETLSSRVILQSLIWYGSVVFFEKNGSIFALPGVPDGSGYNIYGNSSGAWIFSRNGKLNEKVKLYIPGSNDAKLLKETNATPQTGEVNGVIVYENRTRTPFLWPMMYYAEQISDTIRTLEVARKQLKVPYIIFAEESVRKTIIDDLKRRQDNEDTIIGTGVYDPNKTSVFPLSGATESIPRCIELIEWYWGKVKELCGIDNNSQIDKKGENLIQAELDVGREYTDNGLEKIKPVIQEGLDDVSKIFDLSLEVITRKDEQEKEEQEKLDEENGGLKNENTDDISRITK